MRAQTLPRIDPRIAGAEQISVETDSFDNILLDATPTVQEALDWLDDNGGGGGGGGASFLFDAGDDGVDESAGVTEIATVGGGVALGRALVVPGSRRGGLWGPLPRRLPLWLCFGVGRRDALRVARALALGRSAWMRRRSHRLVVAALRRAPAGEPA